jgi:hypothetical protein
MPTVGATLSLISKLTLPYVDMYLSFKPAIKLHY